LPGQGIFSRLPQRPEKSAYLCATYPAGRGQGRNRLLDPAPTHTALAGSRSWRN
jgi:hypothetical protein